MTARVINHATQEEEAFICEVKNVSYDWRRREVTITDEYDQTYTYDLKKYNIMVIAK